MKWLSLIFVVMFAGALAWWFFWGQDTSYQGTPTGVAKQFVEAACKGDLDWAASYCDPAIDGAAREVAKRVQAMNLDPLSYSFQETSAPEGRSGLTALAGGQLLAVELEERGPEDWVIVAVGMGK